MGRYKNKYRIESARLQNWDYGSCGMYFITICTKNREHYFGDITDTVVETQRIASPQCIASLQATEIGKITESEWLKTPQMRPDMNLELGEFVVMPNHFHAIIIIGENKFNSLNGKNAGDDEHAVNDEHVTYRRDAMHGVSTPTPITPENTVSNKFGPQSKNLASVIRGYKSSVTTYARKNNIEFGWQERFHDHIIRNHDEFIRISNYIVYNPENWKQDKFFN